MRRIFPKSEFVRNVLTLMTGTTIAQIIPIAVSPILTRLYSPEQFGVFALYVSIATILSSVATGRYELAILLPKNDSQALNILALSILISFVTCGLTLGITLIFNAQISELLNTPELTNWLYLASVTVLLTGIYQSLHYWNNREKNYVYLSASKVIQSSTTSLFNVAMGLLKYGVNGLIIGTIVGLLLATFVLANNTIKQNYNFFAGIKLIKIYALARRYINFLKFSTVSALFNNLSNVGLPIIIGLFFDNVVVGLYYFAFRIIKLPLKLIFNSLSQVYFQKAAQLFKTNKMELLKFTHKIQIRIAIFVIPFLIITSIIAPYVFDFVFGSEWAAAGEYVKYFAIFIFFNSIYSPVSAIGAILNKQLVMLLFNVSLVFSQAAIMYFVSQYYSFEITLLVISIIGGAHFLYITIYMEIVLRNHVSEN